MSALLDTEFSRVRLTEFLARRCRIRLRLPETADELWTREHRREHDEDAEAQSQGELRLHVVLPAEHFSSQCRVSRTCFFFSFSRASLQERPPFPAHIHLFFGIFRNILLK